MNARLAIAMSTALASIVVIAGRGPTQGFPIGHGMCFRQTHCGGSALLGLSTMSQCKATGGKSWAGSASNSCVSFGLL
jgi:hypothetical protein